MKPDVRPENPGDARPTGRPEWLVDLLAAPAGPYAASTWAWAHRWVALPVRFDDVLDIGATHLLADEELLQLTRAAGRRIHFAFETLATFARAALLRFPDDELLRVLLRAAEVADTGDVVAWADLEECVRSAPSEGIANHVLLTAVYLSANTPCDVLERSLELAEELADGGDLIARYRTVSLLRRLGRYEASLRAGLRVNDELVSGAHLPALCDHLSERVLVERHLAVELLARRRTTNTQQERPAEGL